MLARITAQRRLLPQLASGFRGIATSAPRLGGAPPFMHMPPPPPPEFEPDGSPKKYPLMQQTFEHNFTWEHWSLLPAGVFHTVYYGDFAKDCAPYNALMCNQPIWVMTPILLFAAIIFMNFAQNSGSIGIRPKRYTIEWIEATKERERVENTNPVTRYLDRRRAERGPHWVLGNWLPFHPFFAWMNNSHDPDYTGAVEARYAAENEEE